MNTHAFQDEMHSPAHLRIAWRVCIVAGLFFFYEFLQLNIINSINSPLMREFGLSASAMGSLSAMYFWGNFLSVLPAGMLLDRFSTKKLILFAMTVCTISTYVFANSHSYMISCLARFVIGLSAGFCFIAPMRLASRWFPTDRLAFVTGVIVTMAMLGGMTAQTPMLALVHVVGWRIAILANVCLGAFITLLLILLIQDHPKNADDSVRKSMAELKDLGVFSSLWMVLTNIQNWMGALYTSMLNLPVFLLGAIWGIPYLTEARGFSPTEASLATMVMFIGLVFGSPIFGLISDSIGLRKLPMMIGVVASMVILLFVIYLPSPSTFTMVILFLLMGFFNSTQSLSYPTVAEANPPALTGSAASIVSLTLMLVGAIAQPLFGRLMEHHWDHKMVNGVPIYSPDAFHGAMMMMPASFILAFIALLVIRETHCHNLARDT